MPPHIRIENLAAHPQAAAALAAFHEQQEDVVAQIIAIQQIPAPTFAEAERAAYVAEQMAELGLRQVTEDELHNVYGRFPGQDPDHPPLIISAHLDTVFPADTDLSLTWDGRLLYGPGVSDNAAGVAALLRLAQSLRDFDLRPPADVWFVANSGEEGMGNLRGMRAVVDRFGEKAVYLVIEGGFYGHLSHQAIGVRRFRIDVETEGGHSWSDFGATSAVHVLGRLIAAIDQIKVPESPRTSYNVGVVEGGVSINTIAAHAACWLDLRSEAPKVLGALESEVRGLIERMGEHFPQAALTATLVGDRPAGRIPRQTPLVAWATAALQRGPLDTVNYIAGSTDANIPLSRGITAVCAGLTQSGNAHREDEYLDVTYIPHGLEQLLLILLAAAGFTP
jgi:acetylornithine deacetylase/succinyl-diaminopimelate desuccinylase-like protein